jgi:hypothetical protein
MYPLESNLVRTSACELAAVPLTVKRGAVKTISDLWCNLMHDQPSWPICGKYYCKKCWRRFPVPWTNAGGS